MGHIQQRSPKGHFLPGSSGCTLSMLIPSMRTQSTLERPSSLVLGHPYACGLRSKPVSDFPPTCVVSSDLKRLFTILSAGCEAMMQMMYSDGPGPVNGNPVPLTDQTIYRINIDFAPNDTITGVFGNWVDQCCYTRAITGIGFNMASGRQYGPYGNSNGNPFSFTGFVNGIYGTNFRYYSTYTVSSIGFWTIPSSPPPAPPSPPPSLPTPSATPPTAAYNLGRVRTIFNGNGDLSGLFDDGALYSGNFSRGSPCSEAMPRSSWCYVFSPRPTC